MKTIRIIVIIISILVIFFLIGPRQKTPKLSLKIIDTLPHKLTEIQSFVNKREAKLKNLKPGNGSVFIWANPDSISQTEYSFVYLHGFSACPAEGNGIYPALAERYKANVYVPRLHAHGIKSDDELLDFDVEKYWESALEAYLIGKKIGKKVILVGTSTGGTLALMLAAHYKDIAALILYSPNIELYDKTANLLTLPWGLQLARIAMGGKYYSWEASPEKKPYWNTKYRLEAMIRMKKMLDEFMTPETFQKVKIPVFVGYYFKNEEECDHTISVPAVIKMFDELGTPAELKERVAFPNGGGHVMTFAPTSHNLANLQSTTFKFLDDKVFNK